MVVYIDRMRADAAVEFSHLRGVVLGGGGMKWGGWNSCLLPPAFLHSLSRCCFLSSLSLCSVPWNFTAQILTQQDNNLPRSLERENRECGKLYWEKLSPSEGNFLLALAFQSERVYPSCLMDAFYSRFFCIPRKTKKSFSIA